MPAKASASSSGMGNTVTLPQASSKATTSANTYHLSHHPLLIPFLPFQRTVSFAVVAVVGMPALTRSLSCAMSAMSGSDLWDQPRKKPPG